MLINSLSTKTQNLTQPIMFPSAKFGDWPDRAIINVLPILITDIINTQVIDWAPNINCLIIF